MKARNYQIETIQNKVEEAIISNLGNILLQSSSTASIEINEYINLFFEPSIETNSYKRTEYFYEGYFTHFSPFINAISILESSEMWLLNLIGKNDTTEFSYAGDLIAPFYANSNSSYYFKESYDDILSALKQNIFILSLTNNENISKYWNREYTNSGHGVGFVLDFHNDVKRFQEFIISKIKYGQGYRFENLSNDFNNLRQKYKFLNIRLNLNPILPLFKNGDVRWVEEEEVRILTPLPKINKFKIYSSSDNEKHKMIKLPILSKIYTHAKYINATFPLFKLRSLLIGPRVTDQEVIKIKDIISEKYDYNINIIRYSHP